MRKFTMNQADKNDRLKDGSIACRRLVSVVNLIFQIGRFVWFFKTPNSSLVFAGFHRDSIPVGRRYISISLSIQCLFAVSRIRYFSIHGKGVRWELFCPGALSIHIFLAGMSHPPVLVEKFQKTNPR